MSRYIDADALIPKMNECVNDHYITDFDAIATILDAPSIDIVFCNECKHRPIKEFADGADWGFNVIAPNSDGRCPCLVSDGWYSWIPKDDFYCGYGERIEP